MQDISNYNKLREDAQNYYQQIGAVRCPALENQLVHFNSEGFGHLVYKNKTRQRSKNDQVTRFKLLSKAKMVIGISTTYQEIDEGLMEVRRKRFKKIINQTTTVIYWGFVAIIRNTRIKVIIRRVGNGQLHFWSVMPAWKTNQYRDIRIISMCKGDLAED